MLPDSTVIYGGLQSYIPRVRFEVYNTIILFFYLKPKKEQKKKEETWKIRVGRHRAAKGYKTKSIPIDYRDLGKFCKNSTEIIREEQHPSLIDRH